MAKKGMTVQATVTFNGKQAAFELEQLQKRAKDLEKQVDALKETLGEGYKENQKFIELNKEFQTLNSLISSGTQKVNLYEQAMKDMTGLTVRQLQAAATQAKNFQRSFSDNTSQEEIGKTANLIERITIRIKQLRSGFTDAMQVAQNTTGMTVNQLQRLQNVLMEEQRLVATDEQSWMRYQNAIDKVRGAITAYTEQSEKAKAQNILADVQSGNFTGTIAQTKEAIQLLEKYRSLLDVKDIQGITSTDDAIAQLNKTLADSNNQWANYNDALKAATDVKDGIFTGTYKDLEKIRKSLTEYKAQLKTSDTGGLIEVNDALRQIDIAQNRAKNGIVDINQVITNINTTPLEQLQMAAKQLEERLNGATRGTREFVQSSADLREIRAQIQATNRLWENHENVITRTAKRLASYVLVYAGFNEIVGQIKATISANLELSDSLADIRKTTGMTEDAINNLSRSIDEIDTRTGQEQLHELAAVAGQIGLRSQGDVLGFVKASNMITVALNELGSEGTASLMKLAQLTGEVQKMGVEKSLLAIGSSINELSASSAATAGPIVDLMNRLGGIAQSSRISTSELAAIGATADALGQSMEVTGTSMNKFIATLLSSSDQVAYAVNMDAKALRDMLESGETMDAIIAVMQKMNEMGGIQALAPIMGDLGSEGARMTATLAALSNNVDFLKDQVDLSREAFAEATSIQNEYNIKNENAIAILQRMGNAMKEAFVNSGIVSTLRDILAATMDLFNWFAKGEAIARALTSVIMGLTTALLAHRIEWVRNVNAMTAASIYEKITGWITAARTSVIAFGKAMFTASTYTNLATVSVNKLKAALARNWLTLLIGALAAIGTWIYKTMTYVSELTKAQAQYNAELETELTRVDALFYSLDRYNIKGAERKKIIDQINKQYGEYLGFMLSEKDSAEKLAAAHRLVNAELRKKMALSLQSKMEENINEQFAGRLNELMTSMGKSLAKAQGIGEVFSREAVSIVSDVIRNNVDKPTEEILEAVKEGLAQKYDTSQGYFGSSAFFDIQGDIKDFIQARKDYQSSVTMTSEYAGREIKQATAATVKAGIEMLNELNDKYNELAQKDLAGMTKEQTEAHYRELLAAAQNYVSAAEKQMERLGDSEKEGLRSVVSTYNEQIENIKKNLPDADAWGKGLNLQGWKESLDQLSTASVENLVNVYKELEKAPQKISDVAKYNEMFGTSFTDLGQVMDDTRKKAKLIKEELASRGRNTNGGFLWGGKGGNRSAIAEAKRQYEAALSALESYYNERETLVRERAMQENQTEEELQRSLDALEEEHLKARIALRKKILSKEDTSFEINYAEVAASDFFKDIDLNKLSDQLGRFGKQLTQGVERLMTEDEVKILARAWKIKQEVAKELLSYDLFGKLEHEFGTTLDKLLLLTNNFEREWINTLGSLPGVDVSKLMDDYGTEEFAKKRIKILTELSDKSYTLTVESLRQELEAQENGWTWQMSLDDDSMSLLLQKLQGYYDQRLNVRRQYTERLKKMSEGSFEQSGFGKTYKEKSSDINKERDENQVAEQYGISPEYNENRDLTRDEMANEQAKFEFQKKFYEQRIEQLKVLGETNEEYIAVQTALTELEVANNERVAESQRALTQSYMDEWTARAERMGEWGEMFGDFLGEQLVLEKQANDARARGDEETANKIEAQQKKNKQELIKNALSKLVDLGAIWAKELALKMMLDSAAVASSQTRAVGEATSEGKSTLLTIILQALKGQAKEAGSKGLAGLATGAIVFAATMALQALAKSAISNMFPEASVGSTGSSKRKLTTGMLTYAEGDYPVLGNDGQVYNARYQKELKTGVYRGGAHFGIFSEKKPEMIVDGNTTEKLILNYPHIYDAITTIAKHGRLKNAAMPTYAAGDYPVGMKNISQSDTGGAPDNSNSAQMLEMQATINSMNATISALNATLSKGIGATINPYANYKAEEKANRFMIKRGMKKSNK